MLDSLPLVSIFIIFAISTLAVWIAGIYLSITTDAIDIRFDIGEALGGLIFLAIVTNLPEIAIVLSASVNKGMDLAIGNILGGVALQTVVLAILDSVGLKNTGPLTFFAGSLQLVLEGMLLIIVLMVVLLGAQLPAHHARALYFPAELFIVLIWLSGIWLIDKARHGLPWKVKTTAKVSRIKHKRHLKRTNNWCTRVVISIFIFSSIITLIAGFMLLETSQIIAKTYHVNGVVFGASFLALITSIPELATGLEAVWIGDYVLAVSDIFGGNAFLPVLFFPAALLTQQSVLTMLNKQDIYLVSLGALLTSIYIIGLIFRYKRQYFYLGVDSILVVIIYLMGLIGLFLM